MDSGRSVSKGGRRLVLILYLLPGLIPLFVGWLTLSEHARRVQVLTHGQEADGEVTRAEHRTYGSRLSGCEVDFAYDRDGLYTPGSTFSCSLMDRHPPGSRIPVRFDPKDPRGALIVGDSTWPIYWPGPLALTAIWLGYAWALWPLSDRTRGRRRKRARRRRRP